MKYGSIVNNLFNLLKNKQAFKITVIPYLLNTSLHSINMCLLKRFRRYFLNKIIKLIFNLIFVYICDMRATIFYIRSFFFCKVKILLLIVHNLVVRKTL
jgi:peptidoglycan biosynthesis protein MviN/MurJ (putative lipid II flippase)